MKKALIIITVLLIITLIIVLPKYLKSVSAAQLKLDEYSTTIVETPIAPVEFFRKGSGVPILISHGITGGFDQGLGLASSYIGKDYDLIAVSRFGYLGSPLPKDSTPNAQAKAYKHLLDELKIDKAFIFGNSAGGTSAIKFALNYPERCSGLILVSSNVPSKEVIKMPPKPAMKLVFGSDFVYWSVVKLLRDNMLPLVGLPKQALNELSRSEKDDLLNGVVMSGLPISSRTKGIINDMFLSNPDINSNYAFDQIKVPVLIISAKDDTLCNYDGALNISKLIANNKLVSYDKGGHILIGHDNEIKSEIKDFINLQVNTSK